jgi:predicted enzyme related to lactoylglutathione lyase
MKNRRITYNPYMSESMDQHALAVGRAFPWHELYVPNVDAALDFYGKCFDMGTQDMPSPMGGEAYKMVTVGGTAVGGAMSTESEMLKAMDIPPHWAVYMSVDDVDARLEKVKANDGTVVVEPMDIPTVGRMALIADPQGAHIWLYKPAEM